MAGILNSPVTNNQEETINCVTNCGVPYSIVNPSQRKFSIKKLGKQLKRSVATRLERNGVKLNQREDRKKMRSQSENGIFNLQFPEKNGKKYLK